MAVELRGASTASERIDASVEFVTAGLEPITKGVEFDAALAKLRGFSGKPGETLLERNGPTGLVIFVGVGDPAELDIESLRRAGAGIGRAARHCHNLSMFLDGLPLPREEVHPAEPLAIGLLASSYSFDRFRSESGASELEVAEFVAAEVGALEEALSRASAVGAAVALARDLVNTPAGDLSPSAFAEIARKVADESGFLVDIFDEERIAKEKMGGLLGVAAGSLQPPRFVVATYEPTLASSDTPTVAIVGKGITFDSGGLSLKTGTGMMTMKTDMSGAAAVLGALSACRALEVPVRVVGYMPLTENMPSGSATKPGDVLHTRSGQTIEVLNTDAEGRLILADALDLAAEAQPDAIVDLATLTGACVVALGASIGGLLGNDDRLLAQVQAAGRRAGEALWPLPLPTGYHHHIDSEIADMRNIGATGQAGTIAAALLLQRFVRKVPWAHLDIAGPARSEEDSGLLRKGGTGFGVRTILELLSHYQSIGGELAGPAQGITVLP